ncbi:MAG: GNAT family N-acetyltransferase [Eubacteriales bacterium]|nr:GNAT family N-acetyltransferase [Eubacteriales bacterium]
MNYRIGTLADVDHICLLIADAIKEMESKGIYQWDSIYPTREDFIDDIQKNTLYVVEDNMELVAIYVISEEYDDAYDGCEWENATDTACILHRLCVSPHFQNKGVGKQVLLHIEEQLAALSYQSVRLDVYTKNPYALRLYENNGYRERGFADWRKGRFLLMEKTL